MTESRPFQSLYSRKVAETIRSFALNIESCNASLFDITQSVQIERSVTFQDSLTKFTLFLQNSEEPSQLKPTKNIFSFSNIESLKIRDFCKNNKDLLILFTRSITRCSSKQVSLEILQNSLENTCVRMSILINLQD